MYFSLSIKRHLVSKIAIKSIRVEHYLSVVISSGLEEFEFESSSSCSSKINWFLRSRHCSNNSLRSSSAFLKRCKASMVKSPLSSNSLLASWRRNGRRSTGWNNVSVMSRESRLMIEKGKWSRPPKRRWPSCHSINLSTAQIICHHIFSKKYFSLWGENSNVRHFRHVRWFPTTVTTKLNKIENWKKLKIRKNWKNWKSEKIEKLKKISIGKNWKLKKKKKNWKIGTNENT